MNEGNLSDNAWYDLSSPFLFAPDGVRLIQIQPTLRCNLRCLHCYSESGPEDSDELSLESLSGFLLEARQLGYSYVGVSGGEPLLWGELRNFLECARNTGFSTSVSTNGTLINKSYAESLWGLAGIVAVSVDGPPEDHAKMRRSSTAFGLMRNGLSALRDAGVPFTLAFTLTRYNADKLGWLYDFADKEGAIGIHVHPLADFGAASKNLSDAVPDSLEFEVASYLIALLMEQRGPGGPAVTIDVIRRTVINQSNWPLLANNSEHIFKTPFTELVPALVVEPDGCIIPFTYGFPREWSIGFIDREPLSVAVDRWRATYSACISNLLQFTLDRLADMNAKYCDLFGEMLVTARLNQTKVYSPVP